jgi:hypothetical protein
MRERVTDGDRLTILKQLVEELGTPQLLHLIAEIAEQHAGELLQRGAGPHAARCEREARILNQASRAILN